MKMLYQCNYRKKEKINYDFVRENIIKKIKHDEIVKYLRSLRSDYAGIKEYLEPRGQKCTKCNDVKPIRVRHCSTCEKCCIRMDHHCVWINNCIGLHNQRYFIQLISHSAFSSWFTIFTILETDAYFPEFAVRNISQFHLIFKCSRK